MKPIIKLLFGFATGCVLSCCFFNTQTFAIQRLSISIVYTNAALTWPSTNDSETYIVQYRSNLTTAAWTTIADYLPASGSNTVTFFDDTDPVNYLLANGGTNSGGGSPPNLNNTNSFGTGTNDGFVSTTGFYQVVRDGAYMYVANTNWSGTERLPVELGNSFGPAGTMELTDANGDPQGNSIQPAGTTLTVDTTQMTNGVQSVSVSTSWMDTNGDYIESDSPPIAVNVYNEISFPNWVANYGEIGNSALFNFTCGHTNGSWELDIYGSDYIYIGSFNGSTITDGDVSVAWNLVDGNGVTHTNDSFFIGVVTTTFDSGSGTGGIQQNIQQQSQSITPPTHRLPDSWSGHGGFVIVQQHAWENDNGSDLLDAELDGFLQRAQDVGYNVAPSPQNGNPYGLIFDPGTQGDTDWANFRAALYNPIARNLCYFGHGGTTGLGLNPANTNRFISAPEIGTILNNIPEGQTNAHHFRFVFCDGCSTAKGNLVDAFGIPHKENVPGSYYGSASLRYNAFCGWPQDKVIGILQGQGYVNYEHINFITFIQQYMAQGDSIKDSILFASRSFGITDYGANSMTVYGSWDLTFQLDN
jgi:hypothetical protein